MSSVSTLRSFLIVFLIWAFPWILFIVAFGLFQNVTVVMVVAGVTLLVYAFSSPWICLWGLGVYQTLPSPVSLKIKKQLRLVEIQSPNRAVYLFKGLPGQSGIIALTSSELSLVTEAKLFKMAKNVKKKFTQPDIYLWTWLFPGYLLLMKSQEMFTGVVTSKKLVIGLFGYAPFQIVGSIIKRHGQEFSSVDSMI